MTLDEKTREEYDKRFSGEDVKNLKKQLLSLVEDVSAGKTSLENIKEMAMTAYPKDPFSEFPENSETYVKTFTNEINFLMEAYKLYATTTEKKKFYEILERLVEFRLESQIRTVKERQYFYELLDKFKNIIVQIEDFDKETFNDLYKIWFINYQAEAEIIKDSTSSNELFDWITKSITAEYKNLSNYLKQHKEGELIKKLFRKGIETEMKNKTDRLSYPENTYSTKIGEVKKEISQKLKLAKTTMETQDKLKESFIYSLNYIQEHSSYRPMVDSRLTDDYRDQLFDEMEKILRENQEKIMTVNEKVFYGLLMRLATDFNHEFDSALNREEKKQRRIYDSGSGEINDEWDIEFEPDYSKRLDHLLEEIRPLSEVCNSLTQRKDERKTKIPKLYDFYEQISRIFKLSPDGKVREGEKKTLYEKIRPKIEGLHDDSFFNSLTLLYLRETDSEKRKLIAESALNMGQNQVLDWMYTNFLKRWKMKGGTEEMNKKIEILNKILSKKFSDYDNFSICLEIENNSRNRYEKRNSGEIDPSPIFGELKDKKYLSRLSESLDTCNDASEAIECASYISQERFLHRLGEGRAGKTYKVYSKEFNKELAMKIMKSARNSNLESAILSGLDHRNIVRVYYAGNNTVKKGKKQVYSILMDYVDGKTLREMMKEKSSGCAIEETVNYSGQLLDGIGYLRKQGIFHRDMNPNNVKINSSYALKIIDFGIAAIGQKVKPRDNRRYGGESDIFSWGMITYEMATGEHLIIQRNPEITSETYADLVSQAKKEMRNEDGTLKEGYLTKITSKLPAELQKPIITALEYCKDKDEQMQKIISLYSPLRVEKERKAEIEKIIEKKLSDEAYIRLKEVLK